ncbi:hypothetical protein C3R44_22335, partial [Mycobacterium tuberculosis]|uniref:MMPL family transporter n=1 Tax=Mycobacterium tuberculosis TaxID=1773 RepID=UPI000E38D138
LFSRLGPVVPGGFLLGVGLLIAPFVVRPLPVPALATLLGRARWWPGPPWPRCAPEAGPLSARMSARTP